MKYADNVAKNVTLNEKKKDYLSMYILYRSCEENKTLFFIVNQVLELTDGVNYLCGEGGS
jgi:hypothetical protein